MATKDQAKLTNIKCVTNPQHNTPDKTVAMTMLTQQKNFTSVHQSSNRILKCNKNFWGIYAKNYNNYNKLCPNVISKIATAQK